MMKDYQSGKNSGLKRIILLMLVVGITFSCNFPIYAAISEKPGITMPAENLEFGRNLFFKARMMYFNSEDECNKVQNVLDESKTVFSSLADSAEKYYWLGMVAYLKGEIAALENDKKEAENGFLQANELAQEAVNYKKSSESCRLLAASYMKLLNYEGFIYVWGHGVQSFRLAKEAINLDQFNYAAYNTLGTYYSCAPWRGGGDKGKAIKSFEKALESKDEFDNFFSCTWLGITYSKLNKKSEAITNFKKALDIYPNSLWVKGLLGAIEK